MRGADASRSAGSAAAVRRRVIVRSRMSRVTDRPQRCVGAARPAPERSRRGARGARCASGASCRRCGVGARDGERRAGLSSAQLFALQQIAEHPGASINDVAALTFTHQSSVSVVIQRLVGAAAGRQGGGEPTIDGVSVSAHRDRAARAAARAGGRAGAPDRGDRGAAGGRPPRAGAVAGRGRRELVAPDGAAPHPPMLFEDLPDDVARSRQRNRPGRDIEPRRRLTPSNGRQG